MTESDIFMEPHYTVICDVQQVAILLRTLHILYANIQIPTVENEVHYFAQSQIDDDFSGGKVVNPLLDQLFKVTS